MICENENSTVVAEYDFKEAVPSLLQSEKEMEQWYIDTLEKQGYEKLKVHTADDLLLNLRIQIQNLNNITFTDNEWKEILEKYICNKNEGVYEKTYKLHKDNKYPLRREDGSSINIILLDKEKPTNNHLQVMNQYQTKDNKERYDVTVLVNGIPMEHTELKKRGENIKEAFNQINRYIKDSFWKDTGLFDYIQVFVISNGIQTKYYSNTVREGIEKYNDKATIRKQTSNTTFEFTNYWTDEKSNKITDIVDFTKTFFDKRTLLNILTKYCVMQNENSKTGYRLLVMRPYQIVEVEKIINQIKCAHIGKLFGTINAGGYVWASTGSGKTLTSFVTSQQIAKYCLADKIIHVVDRNDLDNQTILEFKNFAGETDISGSKNTEILRKQLEYDSVKIVVTTIQKLNNFIKKYPKHKIFSKIVVFVMDECHRSQFGEMHQRIVNSFKYYAMFGFTGTPIAPYAVVSKSNTKNTLALHSSQKTTDQLFGKRLHTYTIRNGISDGTILPFQVDYVGRIKESKDLKDKLVEGINTNIYKEQKWVQHTTSYILDNFDIKTKRNKHYTLNQKNMYGFNAIFTVESIEMLIKYYKEFKKQQKEKGTNLKIATIFTANANDDVCGILTEDTNCDNMDASSRDFLENVVMKDYAEMFGGTFNTSQKGFDLYQEDISRRMKEKEIDLLIVVNMFLTGFDAPTVNSLFIDRFLRWHGLVQAMSRTNRILNIVKNCGNIICFRPLEEEIKQAIAYYGDTESKGIILMRTLNEYLYGYEDNDDKRHKGYIEIANDFKNKFPISDRNLLNKILEDENKKKEFATGYTNIIRLLNHLTTFEDFVNNKTIDPITEIEHQNYRSYYVDISEEVRRNKKDGKEEIINDIEFEMELIKRVNINVNYILQLIKEMKLKNMGNKTIETRVIECINSTVHLRSKKTLIREFIEYYNITTDTEESWSEFIKKKKEEMFKKLVDENNLDATKTEIFLEKCFKQGYVDVERDSKDITDLRKNKINLLMGDEFVSKQKEIIAENIKEYFEMFYNI